MSRRNEKPKVGESTRSAKLTASVAALLVVLVVSGSILMVLPKGFPGKQFATSIGAPLYSQNWQVFAPNVMKSNTTLEVRAQWRDGNGALVKSDWLPVTDVEQRHVTGNPMPSRLQKASWNPTLAYLKRFDALDEVQQARAQDTFIEPDGSGGFRPIPDAEIIAELGANDSGVVPFLRMDYMLMRFGTLYATAALGENIERVQWRIVSVKANDFVNRFDSDPQFKPIVREFGWRHSNVVIQESVVDSFKSMILRGGATSGFSITAPATQ